MIIADTSAWIEFDRATNSAGDRRMLQLIGDDVPIGVTEPVIMEVLAGARDDGRERELRRLLARFALLRIEPVSDFDAAARIYCQCRRTGVTPRRLLDCLIAAVAHRRGATVLTLDRDLIAVARVMGIDLDPASTEG